MKNSIKTFLDAYVHDNAQFIKENNCNAAQYIIASAETADQGWHYFLSDEEIETYESSTVEQREAVREEIRAYVNKNYNYNLKEKIICEAIIENGRVNILVNKNDQNFKIIADTLNNIEKKGVLIYYGDIKDEDDNETSGIIITSKEK